MALKIILCCFALFVQLFAFRRRQKTPEIDILPCGKPLKSVGKCFWLPVHNLAKAIIKKLMCVYAVRSTILLQHKVNQEICRAALGVIFLLTQKWYCLLKLTAILYSPPHSRSEYHSAKSWISLRSNITRREANRTKKSNCFFHVLAQQNCTICNWRAFTLCAALFYYNIK